MYCFGKTFYQKTEGLGVAVESQPLKRDRNEMSSKLTVGYFVLFNQRDDELDPICLERIT
jgi:hypothetical protein